MRILIAMLLAAGLVVGQSRLEVNTQTRGTLFIERGGTGAASATGARTALLPNQAGKSGYCLKTDGNDVDFAACGGSGTLEILGHGESLGTEGKLDLLPGHGIGWVLVHDEGTKVTAQPYLDTAVALTKAALQAGETLLCAADSASASAYACAMMPSLTGYDAGMVLHFVPDAAPAAGAITLDIDILDPIPIKRADGATNPGSTAWAAGQMVPLWYDGAVFRMLDPGAEGSGGGGGAEVLDDLVDVSTGGASNGDVLTYADGAWSPSPASGGGGGIGGSTGSTDHAVLRADGTGGNTIQTSPMVVEDDGGVIIGGVPQPRVVYVGRDAVGSNSNSWTNLLAYSVSAGQFAVGDMLHLQFYCESESGNYGYEVTWWDGSVETRLTWTGNTVSWPVGGQAVGIAWVSVGAAGARNHRWHLGTGTAQSNDIAGVDLTAAGELRLNVSKQLGGGDPVYCRRFSVEHHR